jgi:hypothetical protein
MKTIVSLASLVCVIAALTGCVTTTPPAVGGDAIESHGSTPHWIASPPESFESTNPGLGASYGFNSEAGFANVYVYTLGIGDWKPGVSDPRLSRHLADTLEDIRTAERAGTYKEVVLGNTTKLTTGNQEFLSVTASYEFRGARVRSALMIGVRNGKLLKFRVTLYEQEHLDFNALISTFVRAVLANDPSTKPIIF